ncbi:MAG TPA: hypothetical protein VJ936_03805 [Desulfobacteraceae bacterium]|nr:hypothetical protein [Desulfobacteraceae bacterium]
MKTTSLTRAIRCCAVFFTVVMGLATIVATSGDSGDSTAEPAAETETETGVAIDMPADGDASVEGDTLSFISRLSSPADEETYTYSWVSSQDGELGTTANVTSNALSAGDHDIVLTVTDGNGNTVGSDAIAITVGDGDSADATTDNTSPNVDITSPSTDMSFNLGEIISFEGVGTDAEDGDLTGDALVWSSNVNGGIGTGVSIAVDVLSQGEHTITLTATDSKGSSSNAFIIITVGSSSNAPAVNISSPASSPDGTYGANAGDTINFTGSATDYDGSAITGENLEWISSKDGTLGTGSELPIDTRYVAQTGNPLKEGEHTIYLRAAGSAGTGQTSITITLANTSPVAEISNPPETCPDTNTLCKTFASGEWIDFQGSAEDTEDGDLSGSSLEWRSHIDGLLGTGQSLSINTGNVQALNNAAMSNGEHIITLEATDEWGAPGTDSVIINIGVNTPPVPTITEPSGDYTSLTPTGFVTFYGKGEDAEDGSLTSDDLEWYRSDQEEKITPEEVAGSGLLSSSVRLDISSFDAGTHTISLAATDSSGEKAMASRSLTVPE